MSSSGGVLEREGDKNCWLYLRNIKGKRWSDLKELETFFFEGCCLPCSCLTWFKERREIGALIITNLPKRKMRTGTDDDGKKSMMVDTLKERVDISGEGWTMESVNL